MHIHTYTIIFLWIRSSTVHQPPPPPPPVLQRSSNENVRGLLQRNCHRLNALHNAHIKVNHLLANNIEAKQFIDYDNDFIYTLAAKSWIAEQTAT